MGAIESDHPFMSDWNLRLYSRFPILWYHPLFDVSSNDVGRDIVQAIKYQNAPELAQYMGRLLGLKIMESEKDLPEALVPVPLHHEKERRRGYNQAELIANGISQITNIPVRHQLCSRQINTLTQTKMNRWQRMENMESVFNLNSDSESTPKSILLCDDVLTTGSTIESLRNCFPHQTKVAVATLGVA